MYGIIVVAFLLQVPWTDLRYLFGEIMYGGHITDDWDRRLCRTYLEEYMKAELVSLRTISFLHNHATLSLAGWGAGVCSRLSTASKLRVRWLPHIH